MVYRVIGLMSGSSLDGVDIVFAELEESGGKWNYEIKAAECYKYNDEWMNKLQHAIKLDAYNYLLLHSEYGKFLGEKINRFIDAHSLHHQIQLISSHGHTAFHAPQSGMTAQLGDGAAIAAATGINVVSDLRAMDIALGGQGAPIVPMGEKLLWNDFDYFLNIGGIANISVKQNDSFIAFDVCPANRVMNMLAQKENKMFDKNGTMAAQGTVNAQLLEKLNELDYYKISYPKSLPNSFGTDIIFPFIESFHLSTADALRTYAEHIVQQINNAIQKISQLSIVNRQLLITGGGAFNIFLMERLKDDLKEINIDAIIPDENIVKYKEALIMALLGVLRWREENTTLASVTGAVRNSIGGAVWMGQEA